MKIGPTPEQTTGAHAPAAKRPGPDLEAAAQAKQTATRPATGSSVSMSVLGRTMEASRRAESSDIDQAKVDEIKAAIADGSYKVDAGAIADKMLANAQEMLQPKGAVGH